MAYEDFVSSESIAIRPILDAFVKQIHPAGRIATGDVLVEFASPQLEHFLNIARQLATMIEVAKRPLNDGRVSDALGILPLQLTAATNVMNTHHAIGQRVRAAEANVEVMTYGTRQKFSAARVKDVEDLLEIAGIQLDAEVKYLRILKDGLVVRSHGSGNFSPRVCAGSFVARGIIVAEVLK